VIPDRWVDDDRLLAELGAAMAGTHHAVRTSVERGHAAWSWRSIDAELARAGLGSGPHQDVDPHRNRAPVRPGADSGPASRLRVFTAAPLSMEVELTPDGLVGQLVPAGEGRVELEGPDGVLAAVRSDRRGFFVLPAPPPVPIRLRCETPSARLVTDWVWW